MHRSVAEDMRAIVPRLDRRAIRRAAQGVTAPGRRVVAVEGGTRVDLLADALRLLAAEGYETTSPTSGALGDCAFVICTSAELQHAAYDANKPSLRLHARDPFTAYPVRGDSIFTLATAVDLDTGRLLPIPELLTEGYFRNTRNYGYRATPASQIAAAVHEMLNGAKDGFRESDAQSRFRAAVTEAGAALKTRVRHVVEWDAASGFVGEGRLARIQADGVI
jgi:hypothetical protein